jgi:hypothetical protein
VSESAALTPGSSLTTSGETLRMASDDWKEHMDYNTIVTRLQQADCTSKSDAAAADLLNAKNIVETNSRFGSFRTVAELLTAAEYAALKAALATAAQGQPVLADMIEMLKLPGDEQGNGGGIDFGSARVAETLGQLVQGGLDAAIAAKLTGYAQRQVSIAEQLGLGSVSDGDVAFARAHLSTEG